MSTSVPATFSDAPAATFPLTLLGRFNLEQHGQAVRLRTRKEEGLLEAMALAREIGSGWEQIWGEVALSEVYLAEGDVGEAEARYRSGLQLALAADAMPLVLEALAGFAELRALAGDQEGARELARQVSLHPASAGEARARAAEVLCTLNPDGEKQPVAPAAGTFEETVHGILGGAVISWTEVDTLDEASPGS